MSFSCLACRMKTNWWIFVMGLVCMPAEVILSNGTVSQEPLSISLMRVNSSAEIMCSTSLPGALGFSLHRHFNGSRDIVYLNLKKGVTTETTIATEFNGRIRVAPAPQVGGGQGFSLKFSLLGLEDTDVYYCSWRYFESTREVNKMGNGTLIIVREKDPEEPCQDEFFSHIIIFTLSVAALAVVLVFFTVVLVLRCSQFKRHFRPARGERLPRPTRTQNFSPPHTNRYCPYLHTSADTLD